MGKSYERELKMKHIKLYNVIFPVWLLLFFPPVILLTLAGNFIIDSLVIAACYYAFKLAKAQGTFKQFYRSSIIKVWLFGFLADFIGAILLFVSSILGDMWGIPYEIYSAVSYDPFGHPVAAVIIIFAMLVSAFLIFLFNYRMIFNKLIEDGKTRLKIALTIAVVTMPWTFLLPTKWFYGGF